MKDGANPVIKLLIPEIGSFPDAKGFCGELFLSAKSFGGMKETEWIQIQIWDIPSPSPACLGASFATVDFSSSATQTLPESQSLAFLVPSLPLWASLGKQQVSKVKLDV